MSWNLYGEITGFLSGAVLLYPAFRLGRQQRKLRDYRAELSAAGASPTAERLQKVTRALDFHLAAWDRKSYVALFVGLGLFILSFAMKIMALA